MTRSSRKYSSKKFLRTFRRIFPDRFLKKQIRNQSLDKNARKTFFVAFITFLLLVIILRPSSTALRNLETKSNQRYLQDMSRIVPVTHSSIGERLRKISPGAMDSLLDRAQRYFKKQCHWKGEFFPRTKVFDTTTFSVPAKQFEWAAKNGNRKAARFVFVIDQRSGAIERIIDAHETTSDNTVFEAVVKETRPGTHWVFDRGYNRLATLKLIVEKRGRFITRWRKNTGWKFERKRKIPTNHCREDGLEIVTDEAGIMGADPGRGQLEVRRITCCHPGHKNPLIIITNDFKSRAMRITRIYLSRFYIEVFFRHVKTNLRTIHFPSHSPIGVHNWLVLVALSVMFILIMTHRPDREQQESILSPVFPFIERCRLVEITIMNEAWELRVAAIP